MVLLLFFPHKGSISYKDSKFCPEKIVSKDGTHEATSMGSRPLSKQCFVLKRTMEQHVLETVEVRTTDKRTDVWSRDFIIWRTNFGLWAVAWAGL